MWLSKILECESCISIDAMSNLSYSTWQLLPTPVDPLEAEEMFNFADKDRDGK